MLKPLLLYKKMCFIMFAESNSLDLVKTAVGTEEEIIIVVRKFAFKISPWSWQHHRRDTPGEKQMKDSVISKV